MHPGPHPFTLRQLQYAAAVAELLSFRKAAERCGVSQPALSAQLAQMEQALGLRLFERNRRRVLVTPAGREFLQRAAAILRGADDLLESARGAGDPLARTLRVGVIPTVSAYLLPHVAPALRDGHPQLALRWVEGTTPRLVRELHAGELDALLLALEAELGEVEHQIIARDSFVLAAAEGDPLARGRGRVRAADLAGASVLVLDEEHCFGAQAQAFCSKGKARVDEFRATSIATLVQMVAGGAGLTLLPELAVPVEVPRAGLAVRRFADPEPFRTIGLVWRAGSPLAPALRQIAATMRAAYPGGKSAERARSRK